MEERLGGVEGRRSQYTAVTPMPDKGGRGGIVRQVPIADIAPIQSPHRRSAERQYSGTRLHPAYALKRSRGTLFHLLPSKIFFPRGCSAATRYPFPSPVSASETEDQG